MLFNFSGGSQECESRPYGCIQWSQRHWHANLKRAELLNHVPVHNLKDLLLSPSEMLWPMVLHCQFPKRYQHPTESRITWNSRGEQSLTMGWAALCGCVPLFMATWGARWCVQTGHLTFHGTDESHLSPIWLLSQLYCSGATQKKIVQMNLPAITPNALPHHASSQQPELDLVFIWIQGALLLPLRDTQLGILHCPWWFLLGQDWSHGASGPVLCPCKEPCCTRLSWGFPPLQHALTHVNIQLHHFQQKLNWGKIKIRLSCLVSPRQMYQNKTSISAEQNFVWHN